MAASNNASSEDSTATLHDRIRNMARDENFGSVSSEAAFFGDNARVTERSLNNVFILILVASILGLVIFTADRGFDFTDEGYYLNFYADPFLFDGTVSQFGFIYHPLFDALLHNIAVFRRLNAAAVAILAFALSAILMPRLLPALSLRPSFKFAFSTGVAVSALVQIHWLPLTPNYNWLNLMGVLCFLIGAVANSSSGTLRQTILWSLLLGAGIWLCGMAKPPTGVVLGVLLLPFAFATSTRPLTVITAAALFSLGLLFVTAIAIDGSIEGFIHRIHLGLEDAALLGGGYTAGQLFARVDGISFSFPERVFFFTALSLSGTAAWLALREEVWARAARQTLTACVTIATLLMVAGVFPFRIEQSLMQGLCLAAVPISVAGIAVLFGWRQLVRGFSLKFGAIFLLFVLGPLVYALGTGNNQWFQGAHLLISWMGAAMTLVAAAFSGPQAERLLGTVAFACAALTAILISIGIDYPYRSAASLRNQSEPAELGTSPASVLKLTPESATYLKKLRQAAFKRGFIPGTPLIDLTGHHPGSVFALGGAAPGLPWFVSGFPGSVNQLQGVLRRAPCQSLADAWLLVPVQAAGSNATASYSPLLALKMGASTPFPADALSSLGINLENGFSEVITLDSPVGYGRHKLLVPIAREAANIRCERTKSSRTEKGTPSVSG